MNNKIIEGVFYHIYPLGFAGAPEVNDFLSDPENRLDILYEWLDYLKESGFNAIYFGPLFESSSHGYDTVDYYYIDRRLGTNDSFKRLCSVIKEKNFSIVLDGVFNHVGRDFKPFQDVINQGAASIYCSWFKNLNFNEISPKGDPFSYDFWEGHESLVVLNLKDKSVRNHIFEAIRFWYDEFGIDGLRLDVAYCLDKDFLRELSVFVKTLNEDFWLMGEIIHGDYREWIDGGLLDSATNYECYKGVYSSLNDLNLYEIAYSMNRLFGDNGIYRNYLLYSFIDNHDVNRIASVLSDKALIYNANILLFTIPGIPSVYYGSEWQVEGEKTDSSDHLLRPELDLLGIRSEASSRDLEKVVRKLIHIRSELESLRLGSYREILVDSQQFVFLREYKGEKTICAINLSDKEIDLSISVNGISELVDVLNNNESLPIKDGKSNIHLWPKWGSILSSKY